MVDAASVYSRCLSFAQSDPAVICRRAVASGALLRQGPVGLGNPARVAVSLQQSAISYTLFGNPGNLSRLIADSR